MYEEKKEKRRLVRKIFEGVEVIVSLDARITICISIGVVYKIGGRRRRFIVF